MLQTIIVLIINFEFAAAYLNATLIYLDVGNLQ